MRGAGGAAAFSPASLCYGLCSVYSSLRCRLSVPPHSGGSGTGVGHAVSSAVPDAPDVGRSRSDRAETDQTGSGSDPAPAPARAAPYAHTRTTRNHTMALGEVAHCRSRRPLR